MLLWMDEVVALVHACEDRSADIVAEVSGEHPGRVHVIVEPDPVWREAAHRQTMLTAARDHGATHVALVDADEILAANLLPTIRELVESTPPIAVMQLPWVCLARSLDRFYTEGVWFNNWVSMGFKDAPQLCWKAPNGYDHHHREPFGGPGLPHWAVQQRAGGLMHLQFVNERRLRSKQALYKVIETLRWPDRVPKSELNRMYGRAIYESDPGTVKNEPVPTSWWAGYESLMQYIDLNAEPWQEKAVQGAVMHHGSERFSGLDLFGVV